MSESKILPGWFVGTCTNTTANITANLLLRIYGATDSRMHGELRLYGDLGGDGPFHASVKHGRIAFTTCTPACQTIIEWSGTRSDGGFSGTYKVEIDDPDLAALEQRQQEGIWSCSFVRDLGAPDAGEARQVSVFHEGKSEGSFSLEEFAQQVSAGRWPTHTLTATQDCTVWSTVGEFIANLHGLTASEN